jgi:predicted DNA primase small subunit
MLKKNDLKRYYAYLDGDLDLKKDEKPPNFTAVNQEFRSLVGKYYEDHFDTRNVIDVIGIYKFNFREFGFIYDLPHRGRKKPMFERNLSIETPTKLRDFMASKKPVHSYVGGIYKSKLNGDKSVKAINLEARELGFDIDIKDFNVVRRKLCGCQGKYVCEKCFELAKEEVVFTIDSLKQDFGFRNFKVVFSGGGGFHIWVKDDLAKNITAKVFPYMGERRAKKLEKELRLSVVNYLSPVDFTSRGKVVEKDESVVPIYLRKRILSKVASNFFLKTPTDIIKRVGLSTSDVMRIKANLARGELDEDMYNSIKKLLRDRRSAKKLEEYIYKYRYPRYDKQITQDVVRVLRIPRSVHGGTGNICSVVKDIYDFGVDSIESVFDFF